MNGNRLAGIGMTSARTRDRLIQRLQDQGITAGCEADLFGATSMMLTSYLLDRPGYMNDPVAETASPAGAPAARHVLTPREREVLRQLATGRTDREIADALFLSRRTVNAHVTHILGMLGVRSRREAAALVIHRTSPDPGPVNQSGDG